MKNRDFRPIYRFNSEMIQDRAIVTAARLQERVCDLTNGVSSSAIECP